MDDYGGLCEILVGHCKSTDHPSKETYLLSRQLAIAENCISDMTIAGVLVLGILST